MSLLESLYIWPNRPLPSLLVLLVVLMPFLYAARQPMHALFRSVCRAIANPLRLGARWLADTGMRLRIRNREVLFAHGSHEVKLTIEREFEHVTTLVQRDLEGYPVLQRKLMDEITRIEEDYKKSGEVPRRPGVGQGNRGHRQDQGQRRRCGGAHPIRHPRLSRRYLSKIVAEYRGGYQERHHILKGFLPFWRSVSQTLTEVDRNITSLQNSAAKIDANVVKLEKITARSNDAANVLAQSATTQFFIAGLVMLIAFGGAYVNFKLIALPMSAMVGGGDYITESLQASEVAALVIILFETLMGLFLMETLRFTGLFPLGNITEKMRHRLMWASLTILLVLAGVEVALAVMRDMIIAADVALKQQLGAAAGAAPVEAGWVTRIPTFGQMILGFTLPFALAFVAIPLEYFINSGRTVVGAGLEMVLRGLAFVLRIAANLIKGAGKLAIMLYDVFIFIPLAIERWIVRYREGEAGHKLRPVPPLKRAAGSEETL
jgi:hypothetical protein